MQYKLIIPILIICNLVILQILVPSIGIPGLIKYGDIRPCIPLGPAHYKVLGGSLDDLTFDGEFQCFLRPEGKLDLPRYNTGNNLLRDWWYGYI